MKNKLIEAVDFRFTGDVVSQLSTLVDETEPNIEKALSIAVPLVLSALSNRVGQDLAPEGLLNMVLEAEQTDALKQLSDSNLTATGGHEANPNVLPDMLGAGYRSIVNQIAVEGSIRPKASTTLLQIATTAVVGVLGKFAIDNEFSPNDFVYWLRVQKGSIGAAMLPRQAAGKGTPERHLPHQAAASTSLATVPAMADGADPDYLPTPSARFAGLPWQWGAMLLLAVCLGYFFGHSRLGSSPRPVAPRALAANNPDLATSLAASLISPDVAPIPERMAFEPAPVSPAPLPTAPTPPPTAAPPKTGRATKVPAVPAAPALSRPARTGPSAGGDSPGRYDQDRDTYIYDTGRPITLTLADGTTQKVGANSTENRLYTFLASPKVQVDSVNRTKGWINFDRINFETGKALLTPESALQLGNIASILNTFPNAVVKIGGYTDSTGEALVNYQLSEDRARAAMLTLAGMGVRADRLQAKGYGPKYFVKPNNSATGRALNRRVSIRVVRK